MSKTIHDIAAITGLSKSTVSRALNGSYGVNPKTMEKVNKAAKELGYVPNLGAKQLVTKKSGLVGVFAPEISFDTMRDSEDMLPPIRKALSLNKKDMLVFSVPFEDYKSDSLKEWVGLRNLEGCIILPPFSQEHRLLQEALSLNIPTVNLFEILGPSCSSVSSDNYAGGKIAGQYLANEGHRTIGFINGPISLMLCKDRYRGFCDGLKEATGIIHDPNLLEIGDFSAESGKNSVIALLERNTEITAVCCANDLMATGVLQELYRKSIFVPRDISVMGYDGAFFSEYTTPALTTISHSFDKIGTKVAELLIEIINGGASRVESISPELIIRDSVSTASLSSYI